MRRGQSELTKERKTKMRDETKRKKDKKEIKLPDLKVAKDPKGGVPPPCGPGRSGPRPSIPPPC
jgi:hypothetical protein